MNDLGDIKEEITNLVLSGRKDEAVTLLRAKFGIDQAEAEKLLKAAVRETITPGVLFKRLPHVVTGGKGCRKTVFGMVAFGFGFFGIPMFLAALGFGIYFHYDSKNRIEIYGTVADFDTQTNSSGTTQYTPVIRYQVNEKEYKCKGTVYQSPPEYEIGDQVLLGVSLDDPASVYIDSFSERWFVLVILGSLSFVFIILMLVFTFMSRRL